MAETSTTVIPAGRFTWVRLTILTFCYILRMKAEWLTQILVFFNRQEVGCNSRARALLYLPSEASWQEAAGHWPTAGKAKPSEEA